MLVNSGDRYLPLGYQMNVPTIVSLVLSLRKGFEEV